MPQPQATRCTQRQLAYWSYWTNRGYHFPSDAVIPEDTCIPPDAWQLPNRVTLAVSAVMLVVVFWILKVTA